MLMSSHRRKTLPAWAAFGVGLLASVFAALQVKQDIEREDVAQFGFVCDQVALKSGERLGAYALILRGGAALFAASSAVDRFMWHAYVETLRAGGSVPGVQGIGFATVIPKEALSGHVARIRGEGYPNYRVWPPGERSIYTSIIYLEPFADLNLRAFGFDMYSEPVRRAAMEQARDTGEASLSGKVTLVQEDGTDVQPGILMYVPVYRNGVPRDSVSQKRSALLGWVYSPYRMNDLMEDMLRDWNKSESKSIELKIFDGTESLPAARLFGSRASDIANPHSAYHQRRIIDFNAHHWLLTFDRSSTLSAVNYAGAWATLLGGFALSAFLLVLMRATASTQLRASRIADKLTEEIRSREELLRKSEERWKFALEGAGDGVWDWNPQTDEALFSRRWKEMIGYAEHEFPGSGAAWVQHLHPDDKDRVLAVVQAYFAGAEAAYVVEFRMRCKDGSWKWILARGMLVSRDADGKPLRMIGTHADITEHKRIEQDLKRESNKNLALLRNASDGIHILASDGNIIEVSDAFCAMMGFGRDELMGTNVSQFDCESSGAEGAQALRRLAAKQSRYQFETSYRRKDGSIFDVEISGVPIEIDGAPALFHSARDVTERKKSESEVRIAATAFASQEGMLITDARGTILRVNNAFTAITGYGADEIIGKNPRVLSSGRQNADFYAAMWKSILGTGTWKGEIWNRRKNGEIYPEHLTITAVKDANGDTTNYVAALTDITPQKESEQEIKHLAFYDHLTGLPNRRLLMDRLQQAFASSARSGKRGALLLIDLDSFKTINDTLGHVIGDQLLQLVAQRLTACVREGDSVARLGGDEFVVLLRDLSGNSSEAAAQTEGICEKLLSGLRKPYPLAAQEYPNTASIGAALFKGRQQSIENLLKQADIAMYQAKSAGRNNLQFFDPRMQEVINARASLGGELRTALERKEFHLYYQVQVDGARRPSGTEALLRWVHPERGVVSPTEFISLAEETGLILPLGQWVLETACAQLKAWEANPLTRDLALCVNVSARQFRQANFVTQVQAIIRNQAILPNLLKLELTESMLLENIEDTIATMIDLKRIGVRFSLDDFGTGYSSLQYLKRLPLDQLKIDKSFVRDLANESSDKVIVHTIIAMAQSLNLDVIAEGVETEEQWRFLQNSGCRHYQGYLFGRPVPLLKFEALLAVQ
jgi:diguanylate cyclase (GGDEF)-like protein/PAS domain S-box-containing protein